MRCTHSGTNILLLGLAIFITGMLACSNRSTTTDLLDASFATANLSPIELVAPPQNEQVNTATPTFAWASRGVSKYMFQLSSDAQFSAVLIEKEVEGTTYTVSNADISGASSLQTATYYWRVKVAKVANNLQSKTQSFFLVAIPAGTGGGYAGALYVHKSSTATVQTGGKEAPYKRITSAIAAADALRNNQSNVTVDILVAQDTYVEEINLVPGISLRGGYEATNWTRNITAYTTTIQAETDTAIRCGALITSAYTASTVVEGFTIKSTGATTGYGFFCNGGSRPTITRNIIFGGDGTFATGIFNNSSSPLILENTITGGVATTTGQAYTGIYNQNGSSPVIRNNLIFGGNANDSPGIYMNHAASNPIIENNTIGGKMNSGNTGIIRIIGSAAGSASPIIRNNIIFAYASTPVCVEEFYSGASPSEFRNNNLYGCTAMYRDGGATNLPVMCSDGSPGSTGGCAIGAPVASGTTSGNVNIDNSGPLFVNINGTDGNINTMADNDWHLGTAAGNCNVRGGGADLSASFTTDRGLIARTLTIPLSGPCTPTNPGASGWSMGAYESD